MEYIPNETNDLEIKENDKLPDYPHPQASD